MSPKNDPSGDHDDLDANNRLRELATIFAAGSLRLRSRIGLPDPGEHADAKNPLKSGQDCLEVPGETVLSVHTS